MSKRLSNKSNHSTKKKRGLFLFLAFIFFLFGLICIIIFLLRECTNKPIEDIAPIVDTLPLQDTLDIDTLSIKIDTIIKDTLKPIKKKKIKKELPPPIDTVPVDTIIEEIDPCLSDTISPWVYPDPSGGLHYDVATVQLVASEPCTIYWKFDHESKWKQYKQEKIYIVKSGKLCFKAIDTCKNEMSQRCESYDIVEKAASEQCPKEMILIEVDTLKFCIDRFEWPNRLGVKPVSNISIYHAMDSCYVAEKRLCTTKEWVKACEGTKNSNYPYGMKYEPYACITRDTSAQKSGLKPECRSYFGAFDMSGNLSEWTNTRSKENRSYYNVMGGFWESGPQSKCTSKRYSYFPENRHNPVGFRCCKDIKKE